MNDLHEVSAKVAIYSSDSREVLVMWSPKLAKFGLPGGHVDSGEAPDITLDRELNEELNISISNLKRTDFFLHPQGRIILAYVGRAPRNLNLQPSDPEFEYGIWKTKAELEGLAINQSYKNFILENWPV